MRLRAKFNLAVVAAFLVGFAAAGALLQELFIADARGQVLQNARIMMSAANAVRSYTDKLIAPVTPPQLNGRFLAVTGPPSLRRPRSRRCRRASPTTATASRR